MLFWSITLGVVAVVLLAAWRYDRKRKGRVGISRRVGSVETDIARGTGMSRSNIHSAPDSFPDGPL